MLPSFLLAAPSLGQSHERIPVRWSGAATCPRPATLDEEIRRRLLGQEAIDAREVALDIRVTARADGSYELNLTAARGPERATRTVVLADCPELQRAAAVLITTALAPGDESPDSGENTLAPPSPESPARPASWALRIGALGDLQSLPGPSGGPSVGAGASWAHLRLWSEARYLFARAFEDAVAGARADVDLFALALGAGLSWQWGALGLGPIVEVELGALRSRAVGRSAAGSAFVPWSAGWAGAQLHGGLGRAELSLAALLGAPLSRPEFVLETTSDGYRIAPFSVRVQLAVSIALGAKNRTEPGQ